MDDDLQLLISLILNADPVELSRDFSAAIDRATSSSEAATQKAGENLGRAQAKGLSKGLLDGSKRLEGDIKSAYGKLNDAIAKSISGSKGDVTRAQADVLNTQVRLLQSHLRERLAALENAFKNERNALRKEYSLELEEQKAAHRTELAALQVAERERLVRLSARLRDESELNRAAIRATERLRKVGDDARARRDANAAAARKAADAAAEFDRRRSATDADRTRLRDKAAADAKFLQAAREAAGERARAETAASRAADVAARAAASQRLSDIRREGAQQLETQRQIGRSTYVAEQADEARRTARTRAFLRVATSTYESGLRATQGVLSSFLRRRENAERDTGDRITNIYQTDARRQTSVIRSQFDEQNAVYTRSASRRIAAIEAQSAAETRVVTGAAVRQAEAVAAIQARANTGVAGAVSGRSQIGGALQGALVGSALFIGIKKLIDAGSDLNESQSKTEQVFGKSAAAILAWSKTTAGAIGVSRQAALEAAGTFGNLFQSFGVGRPKATEMSVALVKLASDLASFNNTDPADAIEALRSGLTGETEPLKRYGIAINDVLLKSKAVELGLVKATVDRGKLATTTTALEKAEIAVGKATKKYGANSIEARDAQAKFLALQGKLGDVMGGKVPAQLTSAQKAQAAYALILERSTLAQGDFARTSDQLANSQRIAAARAADLRAKIGTQLLPVTLAITQAFTKLLGPVETVGVGIATFLNKLSTGTGIYKVVRDGLLGVSVALGAILAVKAAGEVLGFVSSGLTLLAANPAILVLAALGATASILYRNVPGIKNFFGALITGTRDWIKVGFNIDRPVTSLSKIVALQSGIGAAARSVRDLFSGLATGTRDWIKVAQTIDRPVTSLSNIVALQTGLGFAAVQIREHLGEIGQGIRDLVASADPGALKQALDSLASGLTDGLSPVVAKLTDGLRDVFVEVGAWISTNLGPILSRSSINIGAFLLSALGLGGTGGGAITSLLRRGITKAFLGAIDPRALSSIFTAGVGQLSTAQGASEIGKKINEVFVTGLARAKAIGINIGSFFSGLFSGTLEFGDTANNIGARLRATIEAGLSKVGDLSAPAGKAIGSAASGIGDLFTTYVLPKLIELPRIIGRGISRTAFSEPFLKTVLAASAGLAGVAVVLVGQFIRGFAEGLISRRGDILKVVVDTLKFVAGATLGSGNPFLILGGLIVAAIAGAKVFGAISALRDRFKIAAVGIKGDFQSTQVAVGNLRAETAKIQGPGAGVANATLGLRRAYDGTSKVIGALGTVTDKAFEGAGKLGIRLQEIGRPGGAIYGVGRSLEVVDQKAVKVTTNIADYFRNNAGVGMTLAVSAAAGAISGYFAAMEKDATTRALGIVAAGVTIGNAFATGGPVVGGITAVATGIGLVFGNAQRKSREAKEKIAADAAKLKAVGADLGKSFRESFEKIGSTNALAKAAVVSDVLSSKLKENGAGAKDFFRRFDADLGDTARAAAGGTESLRKYANSLIDSKVSDIIRGDTQAVKDFSSVLGPAIDATSDKAAKFASKLDLTQGQFQSLQGVFSQFKDGKIDVEQLTQAMGFLGLSTKDANDLIATYRENATTALQGTEGGLFAGVLARQLADAVKAQQTLGEVQAEAIRLAELTGPLADRFSSAYGRIKDSIDRARTAYQNFVDSQNGKKVSVAQGRVDLRNLGSTFATGVDGESNLAAQDRRDLALADAQRTLGDVIAQLARESGGNVDTLRAKLNDYFNTLEEGDPKLKGFIEQLRGTVSDGGLQLAIDSSPTIESIEGIKTKLADVFTLAGTPIQVKLDDADPKEKTKIIAGELLKLAQSDPTVKSYLTKDGNYQKTLDGILADSSYLNGLTPTVNVELRAKLDATLEKLFGGGFLRNAFGLDGPKVSGQAEGAYVTKPGVYVRGEGSKPEVVLPLTNPRRMAELLAIPEVTRALATVPAPATQAPSFGATSTSTTTASVDLSGMTIVEAAKPKQTALEVVAQAKKGAFLTGATMPEGTFVG